uniref:Uncharacterized protein n=1 Tax=Noctiluca scintillans TaxID=2966 RepID=A0A7S1A7W6_NOCSC|mmetsp:Transcript_34233/g.91372  ORF Transcript_34233/g.91372 Transcript_34233/m.91372 type:complete len:338 (+) Transcript_34233:37-1050(+)|eukprot:CAMPEP_0194497680 /NCGR_PEP_ID=MMETSP0253-20130528/14546_1 /TAXON_ID=2966 /ORGANISM="Noctiluca scintillans" /LENGTH=337 /DNA_ID=CAMNT_0039339207 /DNA_START=8 /DNA_END=1021 /DNA_ORIENTATION=-
MAGIQPSANALFDEALRQLSVAHYATITTLEAELQRMRDDTTRLRQELAERQVAVSVAPQEVPTPAAPACLAIVPVLESKGCAVLPDPVSPVAAGGEPPDVDRMLDAVLAEHGWQHLAVTRHGDTQWSVANTLLYLRCVRPQEAHLNCGQPGRLMASQDGQTWEPLENVIRGRRLQKSVRTAPVATVMGSSEQSPIRLADFNCPAPQHTSQEKQAASARVRDALPLTSVSAPMVQRSLDFAATSASSQSSVVSRAAPLSVNGHVPASHPMCGLTLEGGLQTSPAQQTSHQHPPRLDGLPAFSDAFATTHGPVSVSSNSAQYYAQFCVPAPRSLRKQS